MTPQLKTIESISLAELTNLLPGIQKEGLLLPEGPFSLITAQNPEGKSLAFSLINHLPTQRKSRILRLHASEQYYSLLPVLIEQSEQLAKQHKSEHLLFLLSDALPEFSLIKQALLNRLWSLPTRALSWGIMSKHTLLQSPWMQVKESSEAPLQLQLWKELPSEIRDKISTLSSKILSLVPPLPIDADHSFAIYRQDVPFGWCLTQRLCNDTLLIVSLHVKQAHPLLFSLLAEHLHQSDDIKEIAYYYPLSDNRRSRFFEKRLRPISREAHRLYLTTKTLH